jgi:hypothetical protein
MFSKQRIEKIKSNVDPTMGRLASEILEEYPLALRHSSKIRKAAAIHDYTSKGFESDFPGMWDVPSVPGSLHNLSGKCVELSLIRASIMKGLDGIKTRAFVLSSPSRDAHHMILELGVADSSEDIYTNVGRFYKNSENIYDNLIHNIVSRIDRSTNIRWMPSDPEGTALGTNNQLWCLRYVDRNGDDWDYHNILAQFEL